MGRQSRKKIEEMEDRELKFKLSIAEHSNKIKFQAHNKKEVSPIEEIEKELLELALNNPEDFKCKLKSNDIDKKVKLLAKFLFSKYRAPKILEQVWDGPIKDGNRVSKKKSSDIRYRKWFICAATGGSLYKEHLKSFLTKKEGAIFVSCPFEITIPQAIIYSIAMAEGGNSGLALRISKSKIQDKLYETEFWKNVIKFFAQKDKTPETVEQINDLVDFINFQKEENDKFNIFGNGWNLQSLTKRMHDWHYSLRRIKKMGSFTWEGHKYKDFELMRNQGKTNFEHWTIKQIKTSKELLDEGAKQRHCVYGYKNSCINGSTSIWSLKLNEKKKVTIEVKVKGLIVQARGFANRKTNGEEDYIIKKWANENNLRVAYSY